MLDKTQVAELKHRLREIAVDPEVKNAMRTISELEHGIPTTKDGMRMLLHAFRRLEFAAREGIDFVRPLIYDMDDPEETVEVPAVKR